MKKPNQRRSARAFTAMLIVVNALAGLAANLATDIVPDVFEPYLWLSWPTLVLLVLAYVYLNHQFDNKPRAALKRARSNTIVCPYCVVEFVPGILPDVCTNCRGTMPMRYIDEFKKIPVHFVATLAWAGGGRTWFFSAVFSSVKDLGIAWSGCAIDYTSTHSDLGPISYLSLISAWSDSKASGINQSTAEIIEFCNMRRWGNRKLIIQDFPGEVVRIEADSRGSFFLNANVTMFLVSISDAEKYKEITLDRLLKEYLSFSGVSHGAQKILRRNMIVVLTKADLIEDLPETLLEYINTDYLAEIEDIESYVQRMEQISKAIETWLRGSPGGKVFVRLAEHYEINVRYCLVSVVDPSKAWHSRPQPRRILDPIFWVFELCTTGEIIASEHKGSSRSAVGD